MEEFRSPSDENPNSWLNYEGDYPEWIRPEDYHLWDRVPTHDHGGIHRYIMGGVQPGDFLCAVFDNNLRDAFGKADDTNIAALFDIVKFLWNAAPASCWGSPERRKAWQAGGGMRGGLR